jgi:hypothetical protein
MISQTAKCVSVCALAAVGGLGSLLATTKPADARRGFGAAFSAARSAGAGARTMTRATRSAEETARLKQVESRINWSEVAKKGLDVVKTAFEQAASSGSGSSSSSSAGAFGSSTLNVVELEACVRESRWLDDASDAYAARKARLAEESARIDRVAAEIDAARGKVNRSSQRSVDAFNARIREHGQLVRHYNDVLLPEVRREQDQFNVRVNSFNQYCNGKRYYDSDLSEVETKVGFKLGN